MRQTRIFFIYLTVLDKQIFFSLYLFQIFVCCVWKLALCSVNVCKSVNGQNL